MHGEKSSQMKHYKKYAHNAKYDQILCFMRPNKLHEDFKFPHLQEM